MVCFNKSESYNFPVFKYLYNFIEDEGEVRRALKFFNFDKLMEILDVKQRSSLYMSNVFTREHIKMNLDFKDKNDYLRYIAKLSMTLGIGKE